MFLSEFITLTLVIDPFGSIPLILSLVGAGKTPPRRYCGVIVREALIALLVLVSFLLGGNHILSALGISQASLGISGGIVLFLIALRMIFPGVGGALVSGESKDAGDSALVVPIAIPLIAGPSSMATVMLMAAAKPDHILLHLAALAAAWAFAVCTLLCGPLIARLLGARALLAIEKLMGMLLVSISVEMILHQLRAI